MGRDDLPDMYVRATKGCRPQGKCGHIRASYLQCIVESPFQWAVVPPHFVSCNTSGKCYMRYRIAGKFDEFTGYECLARKSLVNG